MSSGAVDVGKKVNIFAADPKCLPIRAAIIIGPSIAAFR